MDNTYTFYNFVANFKTIEQMDFSQHVLRKGLAQVYSPQELFSKFEEYVNYNCTKGIVWTYEVQSSKEGKSLFPVPHVPPLTVKAFCLFAGISHGRFLNYLNPQNPNYDVYHDVAEYINDYCAVNVFNGASVGAFNGNLISSLIKKDFNLEEDPTDARNVGKIEHEVIFTDFEEVPSEQQTGLPEHNTDGDLPTYDNLPPKHSGHFNMAQTIERNGIKE